LAVGGVTIEPTKTYQYDGNNNTWSLYSSPSNSLFDLVDGKSTIYYGTTSQTYPNVEEGDYLIDSSTGATYRWNGIRWAKVIDYDGIIKKDGVVGGPLPLW
jgi:hypothetical protein